MRPKVFIAGDWGTSRLRLYLLEATGTGPARVIEVRMGPGVSQVAGAFEATFFALAEDWLQSHGKIPVILSGMVGSTIGWHEAAYLQCPLAVDQIMGARTTFEARGVRFSIVAGLKTTNPLGNPDVLRGEELQVLGWLQGKHPGAAARIIALPGTHNKWVLFRDGRIETFISAVTGELFALLQKHSVLIAERQTVDLQPEFFLQGVAAVQHQSGAQLLHTLFATRSRQVLGEIKPDAAPSYLSGLLVGADVMGALQIFGPLVGDIGAVTLIGDTQLVECYRLALAQLGVGVELTDSAEVAIAAYTAIYNYHMTDGKQ